MPDSQFHPCQLKIPNPNKLHSCRPMCKVLPRFHSYKFVVNEQCQYFLLMQFYENITSLVLVYLIFSLTYIVIVYRFLASPGPHPPRAPCSGNPSPLVGAMSHTHTHTPFCFKYFFSQMAIILFLNLLV